MAGASSEHQTLLLDLERATLDASLGCRNRPLIAALGDAVNHGVARINEWALMAARGHFVNLSRERDRSLHVTPPLVSGCPVHPLDLL